jgi:hypothetical protein
MSSPCSLAVYPSPNFYYEAYEITLLSVSPLNLFVFYAIRVVSKEISSSQSFLFVLSSV